MKLCANVFEALIDRKFYKKSKVNINGTLMRIEIIKKRRGLMVKHLRSDIAELLRIGHDFHAYERVGNLYRDQDILQCYDFVERFCTLLLDQLKAMNKQRQCPEECKEAVSSLIYAAARFADLPELRKLRSLFTERYGISLQSLVNKEFASRLKAQHTKDIHIGLMQEIAKEHGVERDPKSLDDGLYNRHSSQHDLSGNVNDYEVKEPWITDGQMINSQETINDGSSDHNKHESIDDLVKLTENMLQRILVWPGPKKHSIEEKEARITDGQMINSEETINYYSSDHNEDESIDDIVKLTENMRHRILVWSRTPSPKEHSIEEKEARITAEQMSNSEETINYDSNDHNEDELTDALVKLTKNMRQRNLVWSRTTRPKRHSISFDDSTKSSPASNFRLMPPPYVIGIPNKKGTNAATVLDSPKNNVQKHVSSIETKETSNHLVIKKWADEKLVVRRRRWRKCGALPRVKIHPNVRAEAHDSDETKREC